MGDRGQPVTDPARGQVRADQRCGAGARGGAVLSTRRPRRGSHRDRRPGRARTGRRLAIPSRPWLVSACTLGAAPGAQPPRRRGATQSCSHAWKHTLTVSGGPYSLSRCRAAICCRPRSRVRNSTSRGSKREARSARGFSRRSVTVGSGLVATSPGVTETPSPSPTSARIDDASLTSRATFGVTPQAPRVASASRSQPARVRMNGSSARSRGRTAWRVASGWVAEITARSSSVTSGCSSRCGVRRRRRRCPPAPTKRVRRRAR